MRNYDRYDNRRRSYRSHRRYWSFDHVVGALCIIAFICWLWVGNTPVNGQASPLQVDDQTVVLPCTEVTEDCGNHDTVATGAGTPNLYRRGLLPKGTNSACYYAKKFGADCISVQRATAQLLEWRKLTDEEYNRLPDYYRRSP